MWEVDLIVGGFVGIFVIGLDGLDVSDGVRVYFYGEDLLNVKVFGYLLSCLDVFILEIDFLCGNV